MCSSAAAERWNSRPQTCLLRRLSAAQEEMLRQAEICESRQVVSDTMKLRVIHSGLPEILEL